MPITIYPPILQSTQSPFLSNVSSYNIQFSLQKVTDKDSVKHIQVRITRQSNNRSIVNTSLYPDGIIYKNITLTGTNNYVQILSSDLAEAWQPGYLYKVQMRFGTTEIFTSVSDFTSWKQLQINNSTFSEWSTVMIIKAISTPSAYIQNAITISATVIESEQIENSKTPLFTGVYQIDDDSKESEDIYRFVLLDSNDKQLEDSGWLQHNVLQDSVDTHRFKTVLENNSSYTVTYEIKTVNGYELSATPYFFTVVESQLSKLTDITFEVDDQDVFCRENGCINIYISTDQKLSGNYIIVRASEDTDYQQYEDVKWLAYNQTEFLYKTLVYQDFTIESGIKYKYALQQENINGLRTSPLLEAYSIAPRSVDFEYSYLYHDGVQLRLQFNNTMSTFKHTVLASKQDTLGDKYPHVVKNGYAYYAEFPVTGLISLEMDSDQTFFQQKSDGYYYKDELVIPADKYMANDTDSIYDRDLTYNNFFVERKFREKVEAFLNDFDYKLYRSPSEGNLIVVLYNVSLTPKQELGRMIYEFSATAYEVMENTLDNLNEYKIVDIGGYETLATTEVTKTFGQISGLFTGSKTLNAAGTSYKTTTPEQLLTKIKDIEEISVSEGYKRVIKQIVALRIEQYPQIQFKAELAELQARKAIAMNNGEATDDIDAEIAVYQELGNAIASTPETKTAIMKINNKEIVMGIGKMYWLNDIDEAITSIQVKYTMPMIINYVCEVVTTEDTEAKVVSAIDTTQIWGQISGIFTETRKVLLSYNYRYAESETYRVFNLYPDNSVVYNDYGDIVLDNTKINLYKYKNLLDIIKQETKRQVEIAYNLKDGFTNYDPTTGLYDNGTVYYEFNDLYLFDIEATPGTVLYVGKKADGSDKREIIIGPTGRYILNPSEELISYLALGVEQFAIINYKCLTSQMIMSTIGG